MGYFNNRISNSVKLLLITLVLICGFNLKSVLAQSHLSVGVRAGIAVSNLYGQDVSGSRKFTTPRGGAFLNYSMTSWFSVQPELNIASEGGNHGMRMNDFPYQSARVTFLQVPVLLEFSTSKNFLIKNSKIKPGIFIGPAANFTIFKSVKGKILDNVNGGYSVNQRAENIAWNMTGGVGIAINNLYNIDLRYNYSLSSAFKDGEVKTGSIALTLGVKF